MACIDSSYHGHTVKRIQWNLSWETTATRDHLSWRTTRFWHKVLHFNVNEPVTKDHLSWDTIFWWPMGWSFKTGSTVSPMRARNKIERKNTGSVNALFSHNNNNNKLCKQWHGTPCNTGKYNTVKGCQRKQFRTSEEFLYPCIDCVTCTCLL